MAKTHVHRYIWSFLLRELGFVEKSDWCPPNFIFPFFSVNNCKLFITNSSYSIFAWNHKNKQHKVSPQTCFTLQSDFRALQKMQNMQSSPLLFGREPTVLDASYCHELWASCPKGATAPWEAACPRCAIRAQAQRTCRHPGFLCPPILGNWVTFEASICTNFLNVRPLFRRTFYSGESAIELLQSPAGSWKPGCLREKIAFFLDHTLCDTIRVGTLRHSNIITTLLVTYDQSQFTKEKSGSKRQDLAASEEEEEPFPKANFPDCKAPHQVSYTKKTLSSSSYSFPWFILLHLTHSRHLIDIH